LTDAIGVVGVMIVALTRWKIAALVNSPSHVLAPAASCDVIVVRRAAKNAIIHRVP